MHDARPRRAARRRRARMDVARWRRDRRRASAARRTTTLHDPREGTLRRRLSAGFRPRASARRDRDRAGAPERIDAFPRLALERVEIEQAGSRLQSVRAPRGRCCRGESRRARALRFGDPRARLRTDRRDFDPPSGSPHPRGRRRARAVRFPQRRQRRRSRPPAGERHIHETTTDAHILHDEDFVCSHRGPDRSTRDFGLGHAAIKRAACAAPMIAATSLRRLARRHRAPGHDRAASE